MTLRERFDRRGYSVTKYARVHGLNQSTLSRVLGGELNGRNSPRDGAVRRVIYQLKLDGVWVGRIPWQAAA